MGQRLCCGKGHKVLKGESEMIPLWKLLILLAIANFILIPIEWYRRTHQFRSWRLWSFLEDHLLPASYIVSFIDLVVVFVNIITMIMLWLLNPEWL